MSVFDSKESVFCVGGRGSKAGTSDAGGWTQDYQDANGGESGFDLSKVMGPDGEPIFQTEFGTYDSVTGVIQIGGSPDLSVVDIGMVANIQGADIDDRYEVLAVDDAADTITIETGAGTSGNVFIFVGGAFNTLGTARPNVDATSFNCRIYSNKNETLAGTMSTSGAGNKNLNTRLSVIFFKTVLNDMFPDGANYQSKEDADQNGIDPARNVIIDGDGGAFNVFDLSQDFLAFFNVTVVNSTAHAFADSGTPTGTMFENCKCYDVNRGFFLPLTSNPQAINCWFDINGRAIDFMEYGIVNSCIANSPEQAAFFLKDGTVATNCIINGSFIPVQLANGHLVNCTCYGSSSVSVYCNTVGHNSVRSCILMPQPGAIAAIYNDTVLGNTCDVDYNCYRFTDGTEIPNPLATGTPNGSPPEMGRNDLEVDPQLVDPDNGDYRPLNPSVLRGGMPGWNGEQPPMGGGVSEIVDNNEQYEGNINNQYGGSNKQYGP